MKKVCEYIGVTLSLALPIVSLVYFTGIYDLYLYNWLWCGFYGSIAVFFLSKEKIFKSAVIALNLSIILFCAFGALMGGIYGLGIILLHILIPFYSALL
ncbi:MAG: hypothetical protein Q4D65_10205 [Peptostreptococcaceae bacterium]|nr:hypothetical protein [Peptostreptococcaceae bacterium]